MTPERKDVGQEIVMTQLVADGYQALRKEASAKPLVGHAYSLDSGTIKEVLKRAVGPGNWSYVLRELTKIKLIRQEAGEYLLIAHDNIRTTPGRRRSPFTGPVGGRTRRAAGKPADDIKALIDQIKAAKKLIRDNITKLNELGATVTISENDEVDVHFKF